MPDAVNRNSTPVEVTPDPVTPDPVSAPVTPVTTNTEERQRILHLPLPPAVFANVHKAAFASRMKFRTYVTAILAEACPIKPPADARKKIPPVTA